LTKLKAADLLLAQTIDCRCPSVGERHHDAEKVFGAAVFHCYIDPQALSSSRLVKSLALTSAIPVGEYKMCQSLTPKRPLRKLLAPEALSTYRRNRVDSVPTGITLKTLGESWNK
jgi:hypothetical protein